MSSVVDIPFGGLRHALDEAVKRLLPALFERLVYRLGALLVDRVLEQAGGKVIEGHLAVLS